MSECALWWISHGDVQVDVYPSEEAAARAGWALGDDGAALGVEFPDGHTLKCDDWPEWDAELRRSTERARQWVADERSKPKRATRVARSVFGEATIYADAYPEWVGSAEKGTTP